MALDNHILLITEPTISLDEIKILNDKSDGIEIGDAAPLIYINNYLFKRDDITSFKLHVGIGLPTLELVLSDSRGAFSANQYPRDGDVVSVRIAARQQDTFKDIRIDFDIDEIEGPKIPQNLSPQPVVSFRITGTMKVPGFFADKTKSYGKGTSLDHIEMIANDLELGLATNISATDDEMFLVSASQPTNEILANLVKHSYISDNSFQSYSIDPYYCINFVDVNALFNSTESADLTYLNTLLNFDEYPGSPDNPGDTTNKEQSPLILTNHAAMSNTNNFITDFSISNQSGEIKKNDGYKRTMLYFENDSDEGLVSFDVEPVTGENLKDIEEPLKGRRGEERYKSEIKTKYMGRKNVDSETAGTHLNYSYAFIQNGQNLGESQKISLNVSLSSFNPALHVWQKIPISMYAKTGADALAMRELKRAKDKRGMDNKKDTENVDVQDEFLSGYYIIRDITYLYNSLTRAITQNLTLWRREWPTRIETIK